MPALQRTPCFRIRALPDWVAWYLLRYEVLRAPWGQPATLPTAPGESEAIHYGIAQPDTRQMLAGGRVLELTEGRWQIRSMAVRAELRGQGLGREVLQALEQEARQKGGTRVMLHARENALRFYQAAGYTLIEPSHLLFGEIQHYRMEKALRK